MQTESRLRSHPCAVTDVAEHNLTAEIERLRVELEAWKTRAAAAEAAADHDVLTPALNRRGFVTALQRTMAYCQRHGVSAVLLYLDMDGFKSVNDRLGHAAGDAALVAVAELFLANLRESDAVGRLGGDEFALLMLHAGYEEGRAKARQLSEALKTEGFIWDGQKTELGGSFGVRAWDGHTDAEVWLTEADAAMWVRKKGR
ncbi:Diguanylate cyclase DosC [Brevundimonas sp. G8]|nr:Diguanylate cyclase DosC [Brevundimonas sp. G8]